MSSGGSGGQREEALAILMEIAQGEGGRNAMARVAACKAILEATEPVKPVTVGGWAPAESTDAEPEERKPQNWDD